MNAIFGYYFPSSLVYDFQSERVDIDFVAGVEGGRGRLPLKNTHLNMIIKQITTILQNQALYSEAGVYK